MIDNAAIFRVVSYNPFQSSDSRSLLPSPDLVSESLFYFRPLSVRFIGPARPAYLALSLAFDVSGFSRSSPFSLSASLVSLFRERVFRFKFSKNSGFLIPVRGVSYVALYI